MKKIIVILLVAMLIILSVIVYNYNVYKNSLSRTKKLNQEYEVFTEGEILGTSLITIINKAIDSNQKNKIELDDNGFYIQNETTSIKIEVKFTESDEVFPMEIIGKLGTERFIKNYATINFKCTKKQYHEKTNNIKYILFEQI